jgi:hypothetical protein
MGLNSLESTKRSRTGMTGSDFWFGKARQIFRSSWSRLIVFGVWLFVGWRFPGDIKWIPYSFGFVVGIWVFLALMREIPHVVESLERRLTGLGRLSRAVLHPTWRGWRPLLLLGGLVLLGLAAWRASPTWTFFVTTSLREDEILNIAQYTSRGFGKPVGEYSLARNHICYNVINALLPGSASTLPLRARMVSLLSVAGGLILLVLYGWRRGWFLPACFFAGLVSLNLFPLRALLEARGYGLIFFFGMLACVAFAEWARTLSKRWLAVLAVCTVLGGYTLPYFVVFGGGLLIGAFLARPGRETLSVGILAVCALVMLYAPVAPDVMRVALTYSEEYEGRSTFNYDTLDGLFHTLQFLVPHQMLRVGTPALLAALAALVAFVGLERLSASWVRLATAAVAACLFGILMFFYAVGAVPIRTGAFLAAPLAFLATCIVGSTLATKSLCVIRPLPHIGFFALAFIILWNGAPKDTLVPRHNWRGIATALQTAFPPGTPFFSPKSYGKLIDFSLGDGRDWSHKKLDLGALEEGRLVAIDAEVHDRAEEERPGRSAFPADIRFFTFPLERNYNRLYFRPPVNRGIAAVLADNKALPISVPGSQMPDPTLLADSYGHGDLWAADPPTIPPVEPPPLDLPVTLTVNLTQEVRATAVNFLFTRSTKNLTVRAEYQTPGGKWIPAPRPHSFQELITAPLPKRPAAALRLHLKGQLPVTENPAPALGLIEVWAAWDNKTD